MTVKLLATGVAAVAAIGAAAAGVTSIASVGPTVPQVQPVVFGVPLPLDPADLPTADQLADVLNALQDPSVPFASKSDLISGGIGRGEGSLADSKLKQAAAAGQLPLTFNITNIQSTGPGTVNADVTATGPQLAPTTRTLSFLDQGGWKLSRSSAKALLDAAQG